MTERLRDFEHRDARQVVNEVFENGKVELFDSLKNHIHPTVRDHFYTRIFDIARQHPRLALAAGIVVGAGVALVSIRQNRAPTHALSEEKAQEEFVAIFRDPLSVPFKRTCQAGETAIKLELEEQFVANLCNSSVQHTKDDKDEETFKNVGAFWNGLGPYHQIFSELLYPDDRDSRHLNPTIQPQYKEMIDDMIEKIKGANSKLGGEIEKAINRKIKERRTV